MQAEAWRRRADWWLRKLATHRRERGFPNTVEVCVADGGHTLTVEGTVAQDGSPRILALDDIGLEAALEGTLLLTRNVDVPGVIGRIGTALGDLGVNIATFALGRRAPVHGAEALALLGLDGDVDASIVKRILCGSVRHRCAPRASPVGRKVRDRRIETVVAAEGNRIFDRSVLSAD